MLTYEDCLGLCDLTEEEIEAIAEHEHLPAIVATEYANYLCRTAEGELRIKRIILDDIEAARARGDERHALALKLVLRHFVEHHPKAAPARAGRAGAPTALSGRGKRARPAPRRKGRGRST